MKRNRTYPGSGSPERTGLDKQRRANGNFKVKHMETHIADYLGMSPRAIRFMMPTGRMASGEQTLDQLRDSWVCQILLENIGRRMS